MNILRYREYINTECSNQENTILSKKALKLDGNNSLKMAINCSDLKSCDYLKYKKSEITLIEISDLSAQLKDLHKNIQCITDDCKIQLGKKIIKKIDPKTIIREELRDKYIQTTLILYKLKEFISITINNTRTFIIAICVVNQSDILIFDIIKKDIKNSLKGLVDGVQVVPVEHLENQI